LHDTVDTSMPRGKLMNTDDDDEISSTVVPHGK